MQLALPEGALMRGALWVYGLPLALLVAGAVLGTLLPVTAFDASALFGMGGLVLGLLSLLAYVAAIMVTYWRNPSALPRAESYSFHDKLVATKEVWPVLLLIVVVFGGLFSGLFTATEAGAIGAFFAILIGLGRRQLGWGGFKESVLDTLLASGALFMIAIGANLFTRLVAFSGMSSAISGWIEGLGLGLLAVLLLIALIYLALGMFLEPIGAMLLTLPLFLPLMNAYGVEKIWFGLLLAKLLEIGMITPPVGLNVFVIHSVAKDYVRLEQIFAGIVPFLAADLLLVAGMILAQIAF